MIQRQRSWYISNANEEEENREHLREREELIMELKRMDELRSDIILRELATLELLDRSKVDNF
jgi:hypothetical protein